ncbi:hypothetical protein ACLM5J_05805 [Nocardioides sp. Bht2]|uniref:hypothetical protein n=1 Tax=Nocardioides sp. Bht2 TaxID=3392297 RepID=UPI0039B510D6
MAQQPPLPPPGSNPYGDPLPGPPVPQPLPPVSQPLWQGQQAPIEGQPWPAPDAATPRRRRAWFWPAVSLGVLLVIALGVAVGVLVARDDAPEPLRVDDLTVGDCLISAAIAEGDATISDLALTSCSGAHHGEVFATFTAGPDVADLDDAGRRCSSELDAAQRSLAEITAAGLEVRPLAADDSFDEETYVACFLRRSDGGTITAVAPESPISGSTSSEQQ